MRQVSRMLTATDGLLSDHRVLICDRDPKWSREVRRELGDANPTLCASFRSPFGRASSRCYSASIEQ
jgi:hypothetical protein